MHLYNELVPKSPAAELICWCDITDVRGAVLKDRLALFKSGSHPEIKLEPVTIKNLLSNLAGSGSATEVLR